ncbi:hypothetical protein ACTQ49_05745 [Luteococcus sp. Sow4_B9]|uniref:hypothetical protein n=1 Tax=Luteococcus sp. Sow4_B9 TaxID=3438792 RepID=UPI003F9D77B3
MSVIKQNKLADVVWELVDDRHIVRHGSEELTNTAVDSLAQITYDEAVEQFDPAREKRRRERNNADFQAAIWEGFGTRSTKNAGKGGKGGRGGV